MSIQLIDNLIVYLKLRNDSFDTYNEFSVKFLNDK